MSRIERIILASTLAAMAACFALSMACKGKDDEEALEPEGSTDEVQGEAARGEFEESDEDLLTMDYGEFYEELEPYYERAEWEYGVAGDAAANPYGAPRRRGYPNPSVPDRTASLRLARGATRLGYRPPCRCW